MHSFRQRAAHGLQSGDSFSLSRCFTPQDIQRFAEISRDYNPVHYHPCLLYTSPSPRDS